MCQKRINKLFVESSSLSSYYLNLCPNNDYNELILLIKEFLTQYLKLGIKTKDTNSANDIFKKIIKLFFNQMKDIPKLFTEIISTTKYTESIDVLASLMHDLLCTYYDFDTYKMLMITQMKISDYIKNFDNDKIETAENALYNLFSKILIGMYF